MPCGIAVAAAAAVLGAGVGAPRRGRALLDTDGWSDVGCKETGANGADELAPASDPRCCGGLRPKCAPTCAATMCGIRRTECTDDTKSWDITCAFSEIVRKLVDVGLNGNLGDPDQSLTSDEYDPIRKACLPLVVTDITFTGDAADSNNFEITFGDDTSEAICAAFNNDTWINGTKEAIATVLGDDVNASDVEITTPHCDTTTPARRAAPKSNHNGGSVNVNVGGAGGGGGGNGGNGGGNLLGGTPGGTSPPEASTGGDPFTTFNGKQTQFYLPMPADGRRAEPTSLLSCGEVELRGAAVGSGIKGDTQQWFRSFSLTHAGLPLLYVEVADAEAAARAGAAQLGSASAAASARRRAASLLADAAAATAASDHPDVTVAEMVETRVAAALQAMHFAESARDMFIRGGQGRPAKPLTTLNVSLAGRAVPRTMAETVNVGGTEAFVAVTQDPEVRVGDGYSESVAVGVGSVGLEFQSSVAHKYSGEEAVLRTHIDLRFTQLNVSTCYGPLPEIWGTRPMSKRTAAMLLPPAA